MKNFFAIFVRILILAIALFLIYIVLFDPFGIIKFYFPNVPDGLLNYYRPTPTPSVPVVENLSLNESQRKAFLDFGMSPALVQTKLSVARTECIQSKIGESRMKQIRNGGNFTNEEMFALRGCFVGM